MDTPFNWDKNHIFVPNIEHVWDDFADNSDMSAQETVSFGQAFQNFFTMFFSFSFAFELCAMVFLALMTSGRYRKDRKSVLRAILHGLVLAILSVPSSAIGYSLGASIGIERGFSPLFIVLGLLLPNIVYLLVWGKGTIWHRLLRASFCLSFSYLSTEIGHHCNMLIGMGDNSVAYDLLRALPYLIVVLAGVAVGQLKIHHVQKARNSLMAMCYLIWLVTLVLSYLSSQYPFPDVGMLILTLLLAVIDFWAFYIYYHVDKNHRVMAALEAEAQLNRAAMLMLRMNEESIARTTTARHDLKNTLAYVSELIQMHKYDEALSFLQESERKVEGDLPIVDCGNPVVSSIMNLEQKKAEYEKVTLKHRLIVPPALPIPDTTICSLMTNIIDNAIRGTKESSLEGYIDFSMVVSRSTLRMRCVNPTKLTAKPSSSSKKECGHGYGLTIIQNTIHELGGFVTIDVHDNEFIIDSVIGLDFKEEKA